jgi:hypothetical protein
MYFFYLFFSIASCSLLDPIFYSFFNKYVCPVPSQGCKEFYLIIDQVIGALSALNWMSEANLNLLKLSEDIEEAIRVFREQRLGSKVKRRKSNSLYLTILMNMLYERGSATDVIKLSVITHRFQIGRENNPFRVLIQGITESNRVKYYLANNIGVDSLAQAEKLSSLALVLIFHRPWVVSSLHYSNAWKIVSVVYSQSIISYDIFLKFQDRIYHSLALHLISKAFYLFNNVCDENLTSWVEKLKIKNVKLNEIDQVLGSLQNLLPIKVFYEKFADQVSRIVIGVWKLRRELERVTEREKFLGYFVKCDVLMEKLEVQIEQVSKELRLSVKPVQIIQSTGKFADGVDKVVVNLIKGEPEGSPRITKFLVGNVFNFFLTDNISFSALEKITSGISLAMHFSLEPVFLLKKTGNCSPFGPLFEMLGIISDQDIVFNEINSVYLPTGGSKWQAIESLTNFQFT